MPKVRYTSDFSIHYIDGFEIADGEYEPPVFRLVIYDDQERGYDVKDFLSYPSLEEVNAALATFKKVR